MTTSPDFSRRIERVRSEMAVRGIGALCLSVGSDLPYLTGYEASPSERLTMAVITSTEARIVVPELEVPRVGEGLLEVHGWAETDDPISLVMSLIDGETRVAVGDTTWSVFLVRILDEAPELRPTSATPLLQDLRMRKDPYEIDALRRAAAAADRVQMSIAEMSVVGRTEQEVSAEIKSRIVAEGHELATFAIVASGPNGASPHHSPGSRRIEGGDVVVVDLGGRLDRYCSDTTRTFVVGDPTDRQVEVHGVVDAAREAAIAAVRPGMTGAEIDAAARSVIFDAGFGDHFIHRTGHGIGLDGHEHPYIVAANDVPVEPSMVFSIEPGIYLPGDFGVRIEDIVAVTGSGVDVLNRSDPSLQVLDRA